MKLEKNKWAKPLPNSSYIGRFAPSPTGPLHLGSLYAALASFLHARARQGQWLLRIDDLDTPRQASGASDSIIETLDNFGLHWDGPIYYQSQHLSEYQSILSTLVNQQRAYRCSCSRKNLISSALYPKTCRYKDIPEQTPYSLRIKTDNLNICFDDEMQGNINQQISQQHGDFIIHRKDNITAYQFAVVIDDHQQNISHVVRGVDLLDSTSKQIYLQKVLGYQTPIYSHIPVIIDQQGQKLSKQTHAQAVPSKNPGKTLLTLLELLKQSPPSQLKNACVNDIIHWAITNWQTEPLKKIRAINNKID